MASWSSGCMQSRNHNVPLLIQPAFLDGPTCDRIRKAMDRGLDDAAEIVGDEIAAREAVRRARSIEIDPSLLDFVERQLEAVRPAIERTIRRPLGEREG